MPSTPPVGFWDATSSLSPATSLSNSSTALEGSWESFEYEPLDYDNNEVRYFRVLDSPGPIQCEIWNSTLTEGHTCLSYRWSEEGGQREILINGQAFRVYANVWDFLHFARGRRSRGPFWIDAICIDQSKDTEKNHQVPLIGEIYTQARQVVSWLGVGSDFDTRLCMHAIRKETTNIDASTAVTLGLPVRKAVSWSRRVWDHLRHFFDNDYWSRAWVVQEILLGRNGWLHVGELNVRWSTLLKYWNLITTFGTLLTAPEPELDRLRQCRFQHIAQSKPWNKVWQPVSLRTMLYRYGHVQCSDFHDHAYAFLALVSDSDKITVDYGSNKEEFFFHILAACGTLKCCCLGTHLLKVLDLRPKHQRDSTSLHKSESWQQLASQMEQVGIADESGIWRNWQLDSDDISSSFIALHDWDENDIFDLPLGGRSAGRRNQAWLKSLPTDWKVREGKVLRFCSNDAGFDADFLLQRSDATCAWYCSGLRFGNDSNGTAKHLETFTEEENSGIHVRVVYLFRGPGKSSRLIHASKEKWRVELTRSALLKLLMFGDHHRICNDDNLGPRYKFLITI